MDSVILNQLNNIKKEANSEVTKLKRGHNKKMNEVEEDDARDKRERLVACILSGKRKHT